jgi:alpha-L-rhamnosidase
MPPRPGFICALIALHVPAHALPSPARATALRVEHLTNPLGIDATRPRFSWQMSDARHGARQTGYRLLVATIPLRLDAAHADVWNSGLVASHSTLDIDYDGPALAARQRYYWTVCIRDQDGRMAACAAAAWFETGRLGEAWRGAWIAASRAALDTVAHDPADGDSASTDGRPPLLRRSFTLRTAPVRARIYLATLGGYRLTVNGAPAGPGAFNPDWTDYRYRLTYQTYDATRLLHAGSNAVGVLLGPGWYASRFGFSSRRYAYGPPPVRMILELRVTFADGHEEVIASDSSWRTAPSPVLISEIYDGESYDARLERRGWDQPGFDDRGWRPALVLPALSLVFQAQAMPPIEVTDSIGPVRRWSPAHGSYVFDLGQNIAGWARLHVRGPAGAHVRLRFAEILAPDGRNITQINLRSAKATDTYVLKGSGGGETFEPHFTYHGFRYIEVTGFPGVPGRGDVIGIVAHTALPGTGEFTTSSAALNRLWQNIVWTQRANLYSVPTDCPQRDERMGWMGDAQVFWRTASYNMDMTAFSEKWLGDVRDGQLANGCFPNFAPNFLGVLTCGAPGWADAGVIIPWTTWRQYGDTRVLAQQWSAMQRYLTFIRDSNPDFLWRHRKTTEFGDWLPAGSTKSWGETNTDLISTAFWAYDAGLMAQMAHALGKDADAADYERLAAQVRAAFDSAYLHPDGRVGAPFVNADGVHSEYTQTAAVLALHFGLVPDAARAGVLHQLADDIAAHGGHLTTGFLGSAYILPALSEGGRDDVAFRLLFTRTFPSWLYEVDQGATTTWERWNGDHGDPEMNSYSHYAFGAVGEWLYRYLGGIDEAPDAVGFDRIAIRPRWDAALDSVRATYHSVRGTITSGWRRRRDGAVVVTITIPANTTGTVYLAAASESAVSVAGAHFQGMRDGQAEYTIEPGAYRFTVSR